MVWWIWAGVVYALLAILLIGPEPWIWLFTLNSRIRRNRARRDANLARRDADDAEAVLKEWTLD